METLNQGELQEIPLMTLEKYQFMETYRERLFPESSVISEEELKKDFENLSRKAGYTAEKGQWIKDLPAYQDVAELHDFLEYFIEEEKLGSAICAKWADVISNPEDSLLEEKNLMWFRLALLRLHALLDHYSNLCPPVLIQDVKAVTIVAYKNWYADKQGELLSGEPARQKLVIYQNGRVKFREYDGGGELLRSRNTRMKQKEGQQFWRVFDKFARQVYVNLYANCAARWEMTFEDDLKRVPIPFDIKCGGTLRLPVYVDGENLSLLLQKAIPLNNVWGIYMPQNKEE